MCLCIYELHICLEWESIAFCEQRRICPEGSRILEFGQRNLNQLSKLPTEHTIVQVGKISPKNIRWPFLRNSNSIFNSGSGFGISVENFRREVSGPQGPIVVL